MCVVDVGLGWVGWVGSARRAGADRWCQSWSGDLGSERFQQVVSETLQRPLALHLFQTSEQKLTETATLLNLTKHRLDHSLPFAVGLAALLCSKLAGHALLR